jgi:hypothetical protein
MAKKRKKKIADWEGKKMSNIKKINETPMERLRFADFANLKVGGGKDAYSRLSYARLIEMIDEATLATLTEQLGDSASVAKAIRWHLRGLTSDKAIRKVKTDAEVSLNARHAAGGTEWLEVGGWR